MSVDSRRSSNSHNVPGDQIDTTLLEAGPAGLLDIGSSLGELIGGELAAPVGLDSLFHLTVSTWYAKDMSRSITAGHGEKNIPMRGKPRTLERTILRTDRDSGGMVGEREGVWVRKRERTQYLRIFRGWRERFELHKWGGLGPRSGNQAPHRCLLSHPESIAHDVASSFQPVLLLPIPDTHAREARECWREQTNKRGNRS